MSKPFVQLLSFCNFEPVMWLLVFHISNKDILINVDWMLKMLFNQTWYDFSIWKIKSRFLVVLRFYMSSCGFLRFYMRYMVLYVDSYGWEMKQELDLISISTFHCKHCTRLYHIDFIWIFFLHFWSNYHLSFKSSKPESDTVTVLW